MPPIINTFQLKIGGEAGMGIMTTGLAFAKICARGGLNVFGYTEYPSLIRGGHNTFQISVDAKPLHCQFQPVDILIALNKQTLQFQKDELAKNAAVIYDNETTKDFDPKTYRADVNLYPVPLLRLAKENGGSDVMRNSVALGAALALVEYDFSLFETLIKEVFGRKGDEIVNVNINTARAGYDFAMQNYPVQKFNWKLKKIPGAKPKMVLTGNEGIAMGMVRAGCKMYIAYPMTPASSILHSLTAWQYKYNMIVKQAEDEIAVINTVIGGAHMGVRAACGTSGGGFCLMTEALGLAAITETPIVVVNSQRAGPATGLPTWSGQGDLRFVMHAAQDEFPRVIIAPGDPEECFYETQRAFNIAEKYQIPVFILPDKYLSESYYAREPFDQMRVKIDRGFLVNNEDIPKYSDPKSKPPFKRYLVTKDGVSPRALPGQPGGNHIANSDEHNEFGIDDETSENRIAQMGKRMRKLKTIMENNEIPEPKLYGPQKAELTMICWGSTKGAALQALAMLDAEGISANCLHYLYMWPFHAETTKKILVDAKHTLLVEGNHEGQLGSVIKEQTCIVPEHTFFKYDGRPFYPEEIVAKVKAILKK